MSNRRKAVVGMISALFAPGIGRAVIHNVWAGILLYLLFILLWGVMTINGWLGIAIRFAIWAGFASLDVGLVATVLKDNRTPSQDKNLPLVMKSSGYLLIGLGFYCAIALISQLIRYNHLNLLLVVGSLGIIIGDQLLSIRRESA